MSISHCRMESERINIWKSQKRPHCMVAYIQMQVSSSIILRNISNYYQQRTYTYNAARQLYPDLDFSYRLSINHSG